MHVCKCTMCVRCSLRLEEGVGSPGAGVIGGYQLPHGMWRLKPRSSARACVLLSQLFCLIYDVRVCMFTRLEDRRGVGSHGAGVTVSCHVGSGN